MLVIEEIKKLNDDYRMCRIDFYTYRSGVSGISLDIGVSVNFDGDVYHLIDSWFEVIEYCYLEEDWMKYSLEIGCFLIDAIKCFPNKVQLPKIPI